MHNLRVRSDSLEIENCEQRKIVIKKEKKMDKETQEKCIFELKWKCDNDYAVNVR